jgi:uncharacterized membrane protein YtjA (UPF0391 family)
MGKLAFGFLTASLLSAVFGFGNFDTTAFITAFAVVAQFLFFVFLTFFFAVLLLGRSAFV